MAVRIGNIELAGVQSIATDEGRLLVEHLVAGHAGGLLQDLGRRAVAFELHGLCFGADSEALLETLRQAQADAAPLTFAADIVRGIDFTDVVIEFLAVRQVAGFSNRYKYALRLREHVDEPAPAGAGISAVDASVQADGASWAAGALGASAALQDPTALTELAAADPSILEHLSTDDLAAGITDAAGSLDGGGLSKIMDAVGGESGPLGGVLDKLKDVKIADVVAAYEVIKDPSKLLEDPSLLGKLGEKLGVSDLAKGLVGQVDELTGGQFGGILTQLAKIDPAKVVTLVEDLRNAGSLGQFVQKLADGGLDILGDLGGDLGVAADLVNGLRGGADFLKKLGDVGQRAAHVATALRQFDPLADIRKLDLSQGGTP
jgi:hypothetical protein